VTTAPTLLPSGDPRPVVRTVALDLQDVGPLLARLPRTTAAAWVTGGRDEESGLVGWGEAARLEVAGPERFSRAQRWWVQWVEAAAVSDDVARPGSGPIAFCSFAFDPAAATPSVVVVPEVLLVRRDGGAWLTVVGRDERTAAALLEDALSGLTRPAGVPTVPQDIRYAEGSRTVPEWQATVAEAVRRIGAGELDKVVLARDVVVSAAADIDTRQLLARLAETYPSCWTYAVDGLVGATPEMLVRRIGSDVTSRVLAGTMRRSEDSGADASLATALLGSAKDLAEHEYAVASVAAALAAHCTDLYVPTAPSLLRLANVQHLATDVSGQLADSSSVLALAASLHPTAAVCGTPTERALAVIRELEGLDRGRYAGPVGWVDARGDGELGIALRCGLVEGATARLYAGCGIVAGSDPDAELAESQAKLVAMRDALEPVQ
jgi:menaquinone-specific isochorismate synthase